MDMQQIGEIDLSDWVFFGRKRDKKIAVQVKKALEETFRDNNPHAYLPIVWDFGDTPCDGQSGPPVDDPLTIYFCLPLNWDSVVWKCSLAGLAYELIDGTDDVDGIIGQKHRRPVMMVVAALRKLANELEQKLACQTHEPAAETP
jgi:hypothetical protein